MVGTTGDLHPCFPVLSEHFRLGSVEIWNDDANGKILESFANRNRRCCGIGPEDRQRWTHHRRARMCLESHASPVLR